MKKILALLLLLCVACIFLVGCAGGGASAGFANAAGLDTGSFGSYEELGITYYYIEADGFMVVG